MNQLSWARALPHVHFDMMNTVNKSTSFTPFQLCFSHSPRIILPLVPAKPSSTVTDVDAWHVIWRLETDILKAQDNLVRAKISQAVQANKSGSELQDCKALDDWLAAQKGSASV
jgi:hypothetical protein